MKKFPTVVGWRPNWRAIDTCISFEGRFVSCNQNGLGYFSLSFVKNLQKKVPPLNDKSEVFLSKPFSASNP